MQEENRKKRECARKFALELKESATEAELYFKEMALRKGLDLEFQVPVYMTRGKGKTKEVQRFYIVDFLDRKNSLVFEIDGGYHDTSEQKQKDYARTLDLKKHGYRIFRISNADVMNGKTTAFLYKVYSSIGKDISNCHGLQK